MGPRSRHADAEAAMGEVLAEIQARGGSLAALAKLWNVPVGRLRRLARDHRDSATAESARGPDDPMNGDLKPERRER